VIPSTNAAAEREADCDSGSSDSVIPSCPPTRYDPAVTTDRSWFRQGAPFVVTGLSAGALAGIARGAIEIARHGLFFHRLPWLAFLTLASAIEIGAWLGAGAGLTAAMMDAGFYPRRPVRNPAREPGGQETGPRVSSTAMPLRQGRFSFVSFVAGTSFALVVFVIAWNCDAVMFRSTSHRRDWVRLGVLVFAPILLLVLVRAAASLRRTAADRGLLRVFAAAATVAIVTSLVARAGPGQSSASARSVILVTVDTLRADHLGCYGYRRPTTPNLDRLAASARIFESCYSMAPMTGSSMASLMSGLAPKRSGSYGNANLSPSIATLAERFRNAGYRTGAVVSSYILRRGEGFESGFESFDDRLPDREAMRQAPERTAEKTAAAALDWLSRNSGQPFFLWIHFQDPHGPYTPPEGYGAQFFDSGNPGAALQVNATTSGWGGIPSYQFLAGHREAEWYRAQYDGEIRFLDDALGKLFEGMDGSIGTARPLIVFTADHGEAMGEQGYWFAHGESLALPLLHVPLLIWNGNETAGREPRVVSHADLAPTILSQSGMGKGAGLPGRDLSGPQLDPRPAFSEAVTADGYLCSAVSAAGGLQIVFHTKENRFEAYRPTDGSFVGQVPAAESAEAARLETALRAFRNPAAIGQLQAASPKRLSGPERERLRSLGYIR